MANPPNKHHFIPRFLLARWAQNDGKLWRFTRPFGTKIVRKLVAPAEAGYEKGLYVTPGLPPDFVQQFEQRFLAPVDSRAAIAHQMLLDDEPTRWDLPRRSDWSRFIGSLLFRTPENLAAYKEAITHALRRDTPDQRAAYLAERPEGWPDTLNEALATIAPDWAEQAAMEILRGLIDDGYRGERINNMIWQVGEMRGERRFLISDAPLQHTRPLSHRDSYLVLPISPTRLFIAVNQEDMLDFFARVPPDELVVQVNKVVVARASLFIGACDQSDADFISTHFATEDHDTPIKGVARLYRADRADEAS